MKKLFAIAVVLMFASVIMACGGQTDASQEKCMKGMENGGCGDMQDMKACPLCGLKADFKVKDTKDGVVITVSAIKDGASVKNIQEQIRGWLEIKQKMGDIKPVSQAVKEGDEIVTCPVTGEKFKKSKAYSNREYKGKMYYFCCAMCPEKFKADPEKYTGK
jgi:YHS domain-containing protein